MHSACSAAEHAECTGSSRSARRCSARARASTRAPSEAGEGDRAREKEEEEEERSCRPEGRPWCMLRPRPSMHDTSTWRVPENMRRSFYCGLRPRLRDPCGKPRLRDRLRDPCGILAETRVLRHPFYSDTYPYTYIYIYIPCIHAMCAETARVRVRGICMCSALSSVLTLFPWFSHPFHTNRGNDMRKTRA